MTLPSRGAIRVEEFATAAGLDPAAARRLVEAGEVEGLMDAEGRAVLVFDDTLPSADCLRTLGLEPADTYRPDELRSYVIDQDDGEEDNEAAGSTWTMAWGPEVGLPETWPGRRERTPAEPVLDEGGQVVAVRTLVEHLATGSGDDALGLHVTTTAFLGPVEDAAEAQRQVLGAAVVALVSLTRSPPRSVHDLLPAMEHLNDPRWVRAEAPPDLGGVAWRSTPLEVGDDAVVLVVRPADDVLVTAVGDPGLLRHGLVWSQPPDRGRA